MSQKDNVNTLFKYFPKSPATIKQCGSGSQPTTPTTTKKSDLKSTPTTGKSHLKNGKGTPKRENNSTKDENKTPKHVKNTPHDRNKHDNQQKSTPLKEKISEKTTPKKEKYENGKGDAITPSKRKSSSPKEKQTSPNEKSSPKHDKGTPKREKSIPRSEKSTQKKSPDNKKRDNDENASDSDVVVSKTKRRRVLSDSDEDTESEDMKNPLLNGKFEFKKSLTDTVDSDSNMETEEGEPKLKKLKLEYEDSDMDENVALLDEPTVWLHTKLEFLKPNKIKDINKHPMTHPNYDARTLFVPEQYLTTLTPAMRQWWEIKTKHYDCVLFFKVGKFYELYHMDATIGVNELGFSYMKGDFAHSGFPETAYDRMATNLIERGYKVARIEQTETPDMMQERCKKQRTNSKFDKVVKREVCQVTIKGTEVFGHQAQMTFNHEAKFMLAIVEKVVGASFRYGVCFIDTSIAEFHLGEFKDDKQTSRLLTLLAHHPPTLVLHERNSLSPSTSNIFKTVLCNIKKEALTNDSQFWGAEKTLKYLAENYYRKGDKACWPEAIKSMQSKNDQLGLTPSENFSLALKALGGCVWYLRQSLLDQQILSMARYVTYVPPDNMADTKDLKITTTNRFMVLDSITLSNLKITGEEKSLLTTLDHCCTKFGKRLLNQWICSPSCELEVIVQRQKAVSELLEEAELLQEARLLLGALPDLERQLAQIHTFGNAERSKNHPDGRAILYEEKRYGKKKITDFITTLNGFESLTQIPNLFSKSESQFLKHLTQYSPVGDFPNMRKCLEFFKTGFNHEEALKEGVIAPEKGVDAEYDATERQINDIKDELDEYLKSQEKYFGCRLQYFGNDKKRFQLEVPESNARKAGSGYVLESQRKGKFKRFYTDESKDLLKRMIHAEVERKTVLKDLSRRIFEKFSKNHDMWKKCVQQIATLDVLTSLAEYARNNGNTCVPEILPNNNGPILEIEESFHPCMTETDEFIPNGISIGGKEAPLALLTGPNMGGKSTLMRQVGLLAIMVQIGSRIPASNCRMSIIDRIFTRLGANDDIMAGHSTFLVELSETSAILKHATENSLVLLDELGRGTATYDGTSIAGAVVNFLADLKCRSMFSTHYHNLVDNFHADKRVSLGHMACMVENEDNDDPTQETVTFLYKYSDGPCPKSYGFNAAKLAGMPDSIIRRAHELSKRVEATALKRKIFTKMLIGLNGSELKDLMAKLKACTL